MSISNAETFLEKCEFECVIFHIILRLPLAFRYFCKSSFSSLLMMMFDIDVDVDVDVFCNGASSLFSSSSSMVMVMLALAEKGYNYL